jgi:hypothetical protein
MHITYGVIYFKSYIHKQHLSCGPILFSHFQNFTVPGGNNVKKFVCNYIRMFQVEYRCNYFGLFHCFTVHFDSLSFIHTNSCTFSYNHVLVF